MDIDTLANKIADLLGEDPEKIGITRGKAEGIVLTKPQAMALWALARIGEGRRDAVVRAALEE